MKSVIIFMLISYISTIVINLGPKEKRCVYKKFTKDTKYQGKYYFTGQEETMNKVYLANAKERFWVRDFEKEGVFDIFSKDEDSTYALCFSSETKFPLTLSFDIFKGKQEDKLVTVQSIQELNSNIHELRKKVEIIQSGVRNAIIRKSGHYKSKKHYIIYHIISHK